MEIDQVACKKLLLEGLKLALFWFYLPFVHCCFGQMLHTESGIKQKGQAPKKLFSSIHAGGFLKILTLPNTLVLVKQTSVCM